MTNWKDMTPEEKEELRERLDKAGIPRITRRGSRRRAHRRYTYGISPEEYNKILKNQDRKCAICKEKLMGGKTCVDHNHLTGKVRGLLCRSCNTLIGIMENNSDYHKLLIEAKSYLKFYWE